MLKIVDIFIVELSKIENENKSKIATEFVKKILAEKLKVDKEEIKIARDENSKPYIKNYPNLHFNISHTDSYIAIAFSNKPVGIDIEKIRNVNLNVANRYFTKKENEYIFSEKGKEYIHFFEVWTKKEAYLKQSGKGIRVKLNSFDVTEYPLFEKIITFNKNDYVLSFFCENTKYQIKEIKY